MNNLDMQIIRNREIVTDEWIAVGSEESVPADGDVIVGIERYRESAGSLAGRAGRVGVAIAQDTAPETLSDVVGQVDLIAVDIAKYADGRFFSLARILRTELGFKGELRARGHVVPDQVFFMHRVGFDAYELETSERLNASVQQLDAFTVRYQGAGDMGPLFRERS